VFVFENGSITMYWQGVKRAILAFTAFQCSFLAKPHRCLFSRL